MNQQLLDKILGEVKVICGIGISQKTLHQELADEIIITAENAITTAYQAGQDDLKKKLLEEMPKEWKYEKNIGGSGSIGFNECREQIIKLIERI